MFTSLYALCLSSVASRAAGATWASIPIRGPPMLTDFPVSNILFWHYAEVLVGNPPQNQSLAFSLFTSKTYIYSPDCVFCPADGTFDPSLSKTWNLTNTPFDLTGNTVKGTSATDTVGFRGVLQTNNLPLELITYVSDNEPLKFSQGLLGLLVHPTNKTLSSTSLIWKLWSEGQLLNPVIGMNIGSHTNPRMSVGALDPQDYDGEINWVEAVPNDANTPASLIPVEALRGYQGNIIPNITYPSIATLDSLAENIHIPPAAWSSYMYTDSLVGPQKFVNIFPSGGAALYCNHTVSNPDLGSVYVHFSVDINGVNYLVDNENMVRPKSVLTTNETCHTALQNSTDYPTPIQLGLSFLRSVYLAYRFPTEDCPKAFYGFAFPKGSNRTSTELAQKPRTTPTLAGQCLNFAPAGSTPSATLPLSFPVRTLESNIRDPVPGERTWKVYKQPDSPEVLLRDVDGLPAVEGKAENGGNDGSRIL